MNTAKAVNNQEISLLYDQFRRSFARISNDNNSGIILSDFLTVMSLAYSEREVSSIVLTDVFNSLDRNQTGLIYADEFLDPKNSTFADHIHLIEQRIQASKINEIKFANDISVTYEYDENIAFGTELEIRELVNESSVEKLKNMVLTFFKNTKLQTYTIYTCEPLCYRS